MFVPIVFILNLSIMAIGVKIKKSDSFAEHKPAVTLVTH